MLILQPYPPTKNQWRLVLLLCLVVLGLMTTKAQDANTSLPVALPIDLPLQFDVLDVKTAQLLGRYRNQWLTIPEGYQTSQIGYQQRHTKWAWGTQGYQQKSGEEGWQRFKWSTAVSYQQKLDDQGTSLQFSTGLGLLQHRLDLDQRYDQQYVDGLGFDSSLASGEELLSGTELDFDWSVGLSLVGDWLAPGVRRWKISGLAAHLHRPTISITGVPVDWDPRWLLQGSYTWPMAKTVLLQANVHYQHQGPQQEWVVGGRFGWSPKEDTRLWLGIAYRNLDAFVIQAAWEENQVGVWIAYDGTTSTLNKGQNNVGAVEIGASYRWERKDRRRIERTEPAAPPQSIPIQQELAMVLPDTDGDGIPDEIDKCPLVVGLAVFQGCNDKDQDGVIDPEDACPEVFGSRDRNGCPWTVKDSDLDGVPDDADYCVFIKGLPSLNGCPDTDLDGVSDIDDECPYLKGSISNRGCPVQETAYEEDVPSEASNLPMMIVEFDTDQSLIVPTFSALLEDFVTPIARESGLKILISGHTDFEGDAAYNVGLGYRRANAVEQYLRQHLSPDTQYEQISYGELMPIDSNYSSDGRARNRRAEVRVYRR